MATWVRQGTGTAPSNTDSDLVGQYALDNATAPADFDPAAVNSVRVEWTVTGSGFNDDSWTNDSCALVTSGGTEISQHPSAGGANLQNTSEASDHTDSTGIPTGLTVAQWEGARVRGDGVDVPNEWVNWNKNMGPDGSTLAVSALTVTIDYTPAVPSTELAGSITAVASIGDVALSSPYGYLKLGIEGARASTGDKALLDVTGDIEIIWLIAMDAYPPPGGSNRWPLSKFAGGGERAYALGWVFSSNRAQLAWNDGSSTFFQNAPSDIDAQTTLNDGEHIWVKATLDVDDGAGNRVATFWFSQDPIDTAEGDVTWTAWGSPITTAGTTSIQNATSDLLLAQFDDGFGADFEGVIYAAWVRDGIGGTLVANPDFRTDDQGWSSLPGSDGLGNDWALDGGAVWVAPVSSSSGTAYEETLSTSIAATTDLLDRFPVGSRDQLLSDLAPIAWWQLGNSAGTDLAGTHDLTWNGSPTFESTGSPIGGEDKGYVTLTTGSAQWADIANQSDLARRDDMSFEVWVRAHSTSGGQERIFSAYGGTEGDLWELRFDPGNDYFVVAPTTIADGAGVGLPVGDPDDNNIWQHWVINVHWTGDTRVLQVFHDGAPRFTRLDAHAAGANEYTYLPGTDTYDVDIGRQGGVGNYFDGDIAEISFYDRILRPSEVRDLFNATYSTELTASLSTVASTSGDLDVAESNLPVISGLVLNLDASQLVLSDNDPVSTWSDLSPDGNDATQSTSTDQPTFKSGVLNGLGVVRFDGSSEWMTTAARVIGDSPMTVMAVVTPSTTATAGTFVGQIDNASLRGDFAIRIASDTPQYFRRTTTSGTSILLVDGATSTSNGTSYLIGGVNSDIDTASAYDIYLDGTADGSGATSSNYTPQAHSGETTIGSADGRFFFPGDIAEVVIYDRALSSTELDEVESYLINKWLATTDELTGSLSVVASLSASITTVGSHDLTGSSSAVALVSATLSEAERLSAQVQATASNTATLTQVHTPTASLSSAASLATSIAQSHVLAASLSAVSSISADLLEAERLQASISSVASLTANMRSAHNLLAAVQVVSQLVADLSESERLSGQVQAVGALSASLTQTHTLDASLSSVASTSAVVSVTGTHDLTASLVSVASNSADLFVAGSHDLTAAPLSSVASIDGAALAVLTAEIQLSGFRIDMEYTAVVGAHEFSASLDAVASNAAQLTSAALIELEASLSAAADLTGTPTQVHTPIASLSSAASVDDAQLTQLHALAAQVTAVASTTADLLEGERLSSSVSAAASIAASLTQAHSLVASVQAVSSISADLALKERTDLAATLSSIASIDVQLHQAHALTPSEVRAAASLDAQLSETEKLTATLTAATSLAASLTQVHALAASLSSTASLDAALSIQRNLTATISAAASSSATLTQTHALASTISAVASTSAKIDIEGQIELDVSVTAVASVSASPTQAHQLSLASSSVASTDDAALHLTTQLAASLSSVVSSSADLNVIARSELAASITAVSSTSAQLRVSDRNEFTASLSSTASVTGTPTQVHQPTSSLSAASSTSATLSLGFQLAASLSAVASATSSVQLTYHLAAALSTVASATLTPTQVHQALIIAQAAVSSSANITQISPITRGYIASMSTALVGDVSLATSIVSSAAHSDALVGAASLDDSGVSSAALSDSLVGTVSHEDDG